MKIECLVTNVTPVGSPDKVERAILGMVLAKSSIQATVVVGEPLCYVTIPS